MTATRLERERPPPANESPGAVPAAPGQAIPSQRQDKARKATLQGSTATENYAYSDCTHFPPPTTVDLLTDAIEHVRPMLADESRPTKQRIRILWAAAKKARDLGASDVVKVAFMALAVETNLIDTNDRWTGADVRESVRRFGAEDVVHAITWALRSWNPFENGPLK
jgi:hypothetical protein